MAFMDWLSLQNTRRRFVNHSRRARCSTCHCGAEFWRKPSAIAAGEAKFCSRACYQEWQKGKPKAIPEGGIPWNKGRPWSESRTQENKRREALCRLTR